MTSEIRFWNGADQQFQMIDLDEVARAATEFMYVDYESVSDFCAYHRLSGTDKKKLVEKLLADCSFFTVPGKDPLNPMPLYRITKEYNFGQLKLDNYSLLVVTVPEPVNTVFVDLDKKIAYSTTLSKKYSSIQEFINENIPAPKEQKVRQL